MDGLHKLYSHPTQLTWLNTLPKKSALIYPIFVIEGVNQKQAIGSMEGIFRYSVDLLVDMLKPLVAKGLTAILIFGVVQNDQKDEFGSFAFHDDCCVNRALRILRDELPQLLLITDVCLCAYTTHGHCGIVENNKLNNQKSIEQLARMAASHESNGAHIVAPSDMMDNRIAEIKKHVKVPIMAYSAKFCSALYGPFRDVCQSAPTGFDRSSYQLPISRQMALQAIKRDVEQGASYLMVKPITAYLDIAYEIKQLYPHYQLACYHVSGEYSMICLAAQNNLIDKKRVVLEYIASFHRTCDLIITYFTPELLEWL